MSFLIFNCADVRTSYVFVLLVFMAIWCVNGTVSAAVYDTYPFVLFVRILCLSKLNVFMTSTEVMVNVKGESVCPSK